MERIQLNFELPNALAEELKQAAQETNVSPSRYAAEALEAALAQRRLPRVCVEMGEGVARSVARFG